MDQLAAKEELLAEIKAGITRLDDAEAALAKASGPDEIAALRREVAAAKAAMTAAIDQVNRRLDADRSRAWVFDVIRDDAGRIAQVHAEQAEAA